MVFLVTTLQCGQAPLQKKSRLVTLRPVMYNRVLHCPALLPQETASSTGHTELWGQLPGC